MGNLRSAIQNFNQNKSGTFTVIFALLLLPILVVVGSGVDYGRTVNAQSKTQSALDAALLSAALATLRDGETRKSIAIRHFNSIIKSSTDTASATINHFSETNGTIAATATNNMPTMFMNVAGISSMPYAVDAKIQTNQKDAEVVLVLDFSDSMITNSKYQRMQTAAADLVDTLTDNGSATNIKIGIVPFAALVHLNLRNNHIRSDVTWSGCTQDRRAPANSTDRSPSGSDDNKWGEITSTTSMLRHGCK